MIPEDFAANFKHLTENDPFPWQAELYRLFTQESERIPSHCDIPTGLGKTSVIAVWLLALASHPKRVPRRLAYVVNRRTVVDQTTEEVKKLRANLGKAELKDVRGELERLCALDTDCPLAISTLRGEFEDNREWSADPCRPAVICGTVDLIGSRLLFSGYRAGHKTRPLFAGFLGQDTLLVHDEAHLEPAFQELLTAIEKEQKTCGDARPLKVMQLSATTRGAEQSFTLSPADEGNSEVSRRLRAAKHLALHPLSDTKQLPDKLVEHALLHKDSGAAVLVFARSVEVVEKVAASLGKLVGVEQVQTLTGTMRGKERDDLVNKKEENVFGRFLPTKPDVPIGRKGTVYLVCTSAGEVGVNISAHHLVCDLTTFESMAQRLGRVNRFGQWTDTRVDVLYSDAEPSAELPALLAGTLDTSDWKEDKLAKLLEEAALAGTRALLEKLHGDACPGALRGLDADERARAFSAPPEILRSSPILFDAWALTSIREPLPGRPKVAPFLHGLNDAEPTTHVAWREEVGVITGDSLAEFEPKALLDTYPLKPHEMLREPSYRVWKQLEKLAEKKPEDPVWLVNEEEVNIFSLQDLVARKERQRSLLDDCTVLLSPATGGLSSTGTFDGGSSTADDVSEWTDAVRRHRRFRSWKSEAVEQAGHEKMRLIRELDFSSVQEENQAEDEEETAPEKVWRWYEARASADGEGSRHDDRDVGLLEHTAQVEDYARKFSLKLGLAPELVEAVRLAGAAHDFGKRRLPWQRSIGNFDANLWLAKSGARRGKRELSFTYRHELGSLLDAPHDPVFMASYNKLSAEMKDLTLHLIAAHHGRARPHFAHVEIFDPGHANAKSVEIAAETPQRFARLQRRYGRWGLAFLESLLRAADYAASADPTRTFDAKP